MNALITGYNGFIGGAICEKTNAVPVDVLDLPQLHIHADYFLHFASPSSQVLFSENDACIVETVRDFIKVVEYCKRRHLKLIFPSSSTIYTRNNSYGHTKLALEEIVQAYGIPYLALRIFAGYGEGEKHKKHYASVVYQWSRDMFRGLRPVIYGDGTQNRDFVYISDIVGAVIRLRDECGAHDIGTGKNTSFNDLVRIVNNELGTAIEPLYKESPKNYIESITCTNPLSEHVSVEEGVKNIIYALKHEDSWSRAQL